MINGLVYVETSELHSTLGNVRFRIGDSPFSMADSVSVLLKSRVPDLSLFSVSGKKPDLNGP